LHQLEQMRGTNCLPPPHQLLQLRNLFADV
jgi:hypothetical protein